MTYMYTRAHLSDELCIYLIPERELWVTAGAAVLQRPLLRVSEVTLSAEVERVRIVEHSQESLRATTSIDNNYTYSIHVYNTRGLWLHIV